MAWLAGASLAPVSLLALLLLPWLSSSLPAALQIWSGHLSVVVWLGVALGLVSSSPILMMTLRRRFKALAILHRAAVAGGVVWCAGFAAAAGGGLPSVPR